MFLKDCNPPIDIIYGLLAKFFFCLFMDQDGTKVHKLTQIKNKANIQPPWLNKLAAFNNNSSYTEKTTF